MWKLAVVMLLVPAPLVAQVKVTRILDTEQARVAQVEIPANDTRPLHSHPEALWHIYVTADAPMDVLIEGQPTVHLGPWQAHFFKGGEVHGFHNPNARTARWIELFALKTPNAVALDEETGRAMAVAIASVKFEGVDLHTPDFRITSPSERSPSGTAPTGVHP